MSIPFIWKEYINTIEVEKVMVKVRKDIMDGKKICPSYYDIFAAFRYTSPDFTKVVIIGQDPYPDPLHAHGLAFSSKHPTIVPRSLSNIWKEVDNDINWGQEYQHTSDLHGWAKQGVLLLNTHLTTEAGKAGAHIDYGWEPITSNIIKRLSDEKENIVFMLWGKHAASKEILINQDKHYILKAAHPSPFSARKGFFGCTHFSLCNTFLMQNSKTVIDWNY